MHTESSGKFTYAMHLRLVRNGCVFFGSGPAGLLEYIGQGDSLHKAAARMGMAYSKAWRILKTAEDQLGYPLLRRNRGGAGGGGSTLTDNAQLLIEKYRAFQQESTDSTNQLFARHFADFTEDMP